MGEIPGFGRSLLKDGLTKHDREFFCLDEGEAKEGQGDFIVGLDLGQQQDYTALAIIESTGEVYSVRHLERFKLGTSYSKIVKRVKKLSQGEPLQGRAPLVVDATGVGRAVVDMLRQADLAPMAITITAGAAVAHPAPDEWHVPKRDLVGVLQVLLQNGHLKVAEELPEASVLKREMLGFKVKITQAANDIYGTWREGEHDDLVLAVAVACWWGKNRPEPRIRLL